MSIRGAIDWLWHQKLGRPYRLSYMQYGSGQKPLLLLHGIASSHAAWEPLIRLVGDKWSITAPDLLGFGDSPIPEWGTYDIEQHTRHVRSLLRRFHVTDPVTVVAHSMGCLVAAHLAHEYPQSIERLILYEPPLFADTPDFRAHARVRSRYFSFFAYIAKHPELVFSMEGKIRERLQRIVGLSMRPETWLPFKRSLENTIMNQSAYDELHDISVPTDIVHGRLDFVVTRVDVKNMLADNPNITFHVVNRTHGISRHAASELARIMSKK